MVSQLMMIAMIQVGLFCWHFDLIDGRRPDPSNDVKKIRASEVRTLIVRQARTLGIVVICGQLITTTFNYASGRTQSSISFQTAYNDCHTKPCTSHSSSRSLRMEFRRRPHSSSRVKSIPPRQRIRVAGNATMVALHLT